MQRDAAFCKQKHTSALHFLLSVNVFSFIDVKYKFVIEKMLKKDE